MKVKEILIRAFGFLERSDIVSALSAGEDLEGEIKEAEQTLLYCYNAVENELARFYFPLITNVLYANGHTKSKLELKQSNQCKSKSRDSLRNLDFLSTYLER